MSYFSFPEIQLAIIRWAEARHIIPNGTASGQLLKMVSEMGELCDAEGKKDIELIKDSVGDVMVCLVNYCALKDIDLVNCMALAYAQIKDRKGKLMPDGTFVKE